jgi:hypothetical protein
MLVGWAADSAPILDSSWDFNEWDFNEWDFNGWDFNEWDSNEWDCNECVGVYAASTRVRTSARRLWRVPVGG